MKTVTIHRCPTCSTIKGKTDQLVSDLKNDPEVQVNVVDGSKGEFSVEVDGMPMEESPDMASAIRSAPAPVM